MKLQPTPPPATRLIVIRWISLLAALVVLVIAPSAAHAHGYIVRAIPEDQARLERSPARVQFWFSESLEPQFSSVRVIDPTNAVIAEGGAAPSDDSLLEARLPNDLPDGAYIVELRIAFASDGHVQAARQVFYVGETTATLDGAGIGDEVAALEVVWRTLLLTSFTVLAGALTLYALVLVPAWGNPKHTAGLLPPRVMRQLNLLIIVGLAGAVAGNGLALVQQSMTFFGADVGRVLSEGLWQTVRNSTRFGDTWNWRMALLMGMAAVHAASLYLWKSQPGLVRAFWTANGWAAALTFATMSIASHAAGALTLPWIAVISDWLHGAMVGVWLGGVIALACVLPAALAPLAGDGRRLALLAAMRRFSPLAAGCLGVVIATGIYNSTHWIAETDDLSTRYTLTLAIKIGMVIALVGLGAAHHMALRPERYARWGSVIARVQGFIPTLRLESVVAVFTLIGAAVLSATPVPQPAFAQPPAPTAIQTQNGLTAAVTLTPGGPGVNTYDIVLTRAGQSVLGESVRVRMASPERDWRGRWLTADDLGDGLYVAAGGEIDRVGTWWTLIVVDDTRFAFAWPITDAASVIESRPLTLWGAAALVIACAALVNLLLPALRGLAARMDWSPAAVTVGVAASAVTVVIVGLSIVIMQQVSLQYAADTEPPPSVINPVLPAVESLMRGRAALESACAWADTPAFAELERRLTRTRDETLYALVTVGGAGLPACTLDADAAWDVVNHVRALERSDG